MKEKKNIADPLSIVMLYVENDVPKSVDKYVENYIFSITELSRPKAITLQTIEEESKSDGDIQGIKKGYCLKMIGRTRNFLKFLKQSFVFMVTFY